MTDLSPLPPIYIVDDNEEVRHSLAALFHSAGYMVRDFSSGEEFLTQASAIEPGFVLLDLRMPILNGIQVLEKLGKTLEKFSIIIITAHGDIDLAVRAIKLGAKDFVQKPIEGEALLLLVEKEHRDFFETGRSQIDYGRSSLTEREQQVACALGQGLSNKQIAGNLGISVRTVEMHRARAMQRLGTKTFADFLRVIQRTS